MEEIKNLKFKVSKIVYYNRERKWGVLGTTPSENLPLHLQCLMNDFSNVTLSGNFEGVYEGAEVLVDGDIVVNPKYGKQVGIRNLKVLQDNKSREGIINFLAKSMIEGISIANAIKIYDRYGETSINTVLNTPECLINIKGIGNKTVEKVKASVDKYKRIEPLIRYCSEMGISYFLIMKIDEELGEDALNIIKSDPFRILEISPAFSFKQVDDIFLKNGGNPKDPKRLGIGLLYTLRRLVVLEGSTGCRSTNLQKEFVNLLGLNPNGKEYIDTLLQLEKTYKVKLSEPGNVFNSIVYYMEYLNMEAYIASTIKILEHDGITNLKIEGSVVEEEIKDFPYTLNEEQTNTIYEALKHKVFILTGDAGCVDGDTEYFNGKNWVPIKDYKEEDSVLQYNLDGTANMVYPEAYIKNKASLYQMKNTIGSLDMVLSKDHRFIYVSSKGNINEKPFGEIMNIIAQKGSFSARIIPSFKCTDVRKNELTPERLRLLIAISADGSLYRSGNYWRVRIIKERKIERLRKLIQDVGLEVVEQVFADGYHNFRIPVEYGCKEFPDSFYFLSDELKEVFKEEVVLWDGSVKSGKRNVHRYFTTIKKNADIVQFIFSQFGKRASMRADNRIGKARKNGYKYKSVSYEVALTKEKFRRLEYCKKGNPPLSITPYKSEDRFQYCFRVPSGMLVLRRNNNIFITGNCGKSTITKALYKIYERSGFNVQLLSPTAKACRRLEECTGGEARTIHSFLGMKKDGIMYNDKKYEENTVLIIDEASMLDIILLNNILERITPTTRLILVGDNQQLPSVQAGNVLGDTIDSGILATSVLTDIMRQQENSNIIKFCDMINKGSVFDPCDHADFHYEEFGTAQELRELFCTKYMEEVLNVGLSEVQVITPYKKGELGMNNLNGMLQMIYQKDNKGPELFEGYRRGDRVRHTQNNYKKDVYNGEVGVVEELTEDGELLVNYGYKDITYNVNDICELTLSYASTVHASQGSEYKVVFVILDDTATNDFLFIRRLLYTAVSRGKERVYIYTKPYLVDRCIMNDRYRPRITKLKEFLQGVE